MKTAFLIISTAVVLISVVPYLLDILRHKTKPNIVSWLTWTMLTGIATAAEIGAGEYVTAVFTGASTIETGLVVLLGLRYGFVKYARFDIVCQLAAVGGIILWRIFNSPEVALLATVTIDFIGALPTLRHGWQKPYEETWQTFLLGAVGACFSVLALHDFNVVSLTFPLYLTVMNALTTAIIMYRRVAVGV